MKYLIITALLFIGPQIMQAQIASNPELAKQIDQQIWEPFKDAYVTNDGEKFNSLHTDDVLRVTKYGIRKGEVYKNAMLESFAKKDMPPRTIDFRFEHRIHSDSIAYEVGYYKLVYAPANAEKRTSYGRFHVVLKKIEGIWKIAQDWDTGNVNGHKVSAADFEKLAKE